MRLARRTFANSFHLERFSAVFAGSLQGLPGAAAKQGPTAALNL
jgi:hypothetical protein